MSRSIRHSRQNLIPAGKSLRKANLREVFKLFSSPAYLETGYLTAALWLLSFLIIYSTLAFAQQPAPKATPPQKVEEEDEVLRINTNLVQIEAIVKDKNGNIVTDLKAEDFEIVEGGATRQLDFFSFIRTDGEREEVRLTDKRLTANQLRRTFVFLISNPSIDFGYTYHDSRGNYAGTVSYRQFTIRAAETAAKFLNKFIDAQMGERDLVSIIDTESNLGSLSSFTNDRELLRAAVRQMRKNVAEYPVARLMAASGYLDVQQLIQQNLAVLEMAQSAVEQLKKLPGRKIVVMISRALIYNTTLAEAQIIKTKLNELIAKANQAEVTFYFLSPSGLGLQVSGAAQRLAEETGGRSIYNTNDVSIGFAEILKENSGYYLLAYDTGQDEDYRPRPISVRVKKPGFKVQTRSTVYKNDRASEAADNLENLLRILRSPLGVADIKLTLSPEFQQLTKTRGVIKSSVNIAPSDLEIETLADGTRQVKIDLAIQITAPDNKLLRQEVKNYNLKLSEETWSITEREGLAYQFDTEVNQAGYYRINVGVCVVSTKRCGTVSRFVSTIPNKSK